MDMILDVALMAALLPGLIQFMKEQLGWKDRAVQGIGLFFGWVLMGLIGAIEAELIIGSAVIIIQVVVGGLVATLTAFGYYRLGKSKFGNGA